MYKYRLTLNYVLSKECKAFIYDTVIGSLLQVADKKNPGLPRLPKDSKVWNIEQVLHYLKNLPPHQKLSPMLLSQKTLVLVWLSTGRRQVELHRLSLKTMSETPEKFTFVLTTPCKKNYNYSTYRRCQLFEIFRYKDKDICPYTALCMYLSHTRYRRTTKNLFIITNGSTAAHPCTLARWTTKGLKAARINTAIFKPHSVRAATGSATYAKHLPLAHILDMGRWRTSHSFMKHYCREVEHFAPPSHSVERRTESLDTAHTFNPSPDNTVHRQKLHISKTASRVCNKYFKTGNRIPGKPTFRKPRWTKVPALPLTQSNIQLLESLPENFDVDQESITDVFASKQNFDSTATAPPRDNFDSISMAPSSTMLDSVCVFKPPQQPVQYSVIGRHKQPPRHKQKKFPEYTHIDINSLDDNNSLSNSAITAPMPTLSPQGVPCQLMNYKLKAPHLNYALLESLGIQMPQHSIPPLPDMVSPANQPTEASGWTLNHPPLDVDIDAPTPPVITKTKPSAPVVSKSISAPVTSVTAVPQASIPTVSSSAVVPTSGAVVKIPVIFTNTTKICSSSAHSGAVRPPSITTGKVQKLPLKHCLVVPPTSLEQTTASAQVAPTVQITKTAPTMKSILTPIKAIPATPLITTVPTLTASSLLPSSSGLPKVTSTPAVGANLELSSTVQPDLISPTVPNRPHKILYSILDKRYSISTVTEAQLLQFTEQVRSEYVGQRLPLWLLDFGSVVIDKTTGTPLACFKISQVHRNFYTTGGFACTRPRNLLDHCFVTLTPSQFEVVKSQRKRWGLGYLNSKDKDGYVSKTLKAPLPSTPLDVFLPT